MFFNCSELTTSLKSLKAFHQQLNQQIEGFSVIKNDEASERADKISILKEIYQTRNGIKTEIDSIKSEILLEKLIENLRLKEQYESQVKVLIDSDILSDLSNHEKGIIGIDGQEYPIPSYDDILNKLQDPEKIRLLEAKIDQGFTKLQLVPFALPLSVLIDRYKTVLLKTHQETGIKATDGTILELNTEDPIYVWNKLTQSDNPKTPPSDQMEYHVLNYDGQTKEQRGGKYKSELLQENPDNGWQVTLIEDGPDLLAEGQGKTVKGRKQLEANQTSKEYLKLFQEDPKYRNEQGQTPEAALTTWLTYLQERQTAIDDYQGQGKVNWLVGTYLSGAVPYFDWSRGDRQAYLGRHYPGFRASNRGLRPAARF